MPNWRFSLSQLKACAEREARMRREVYQRRNCLMPLSPKQLREIEMMDEIAARFAEAEKEEGSDLFGHSQ